MCLHKFEHIIKSTPRYGHRFLIRLDRTVLTQDKTHPVRCMLQTPQQIQTFMNYSNLHVITVLTFIKTNAFYLVTLTQTTKQLIQRFRCIKILKLKLCFYFSTSIVLMLIVVLYS